ncbi:MAG: cytochrome c biogenesis heme-transporting ATPase CcmA [Rhodospirillales bacterium]|jgi:heme exporter protein A|nr:cytochrome c biogenesis heme-transporting ATPase CcmA [Rhodospirillales bacterium]
MTLFNGSQLTCIRGERTVFTGLDFAIDAEGMLLLVGPNGSGKSSLLRLMCGLLTPAAGAMSWQGEDIAEEREHHNGRLHYVGHHDAIKSVLTVQENIAFWAEMHGGKQDAKKRVGDALDAFGIPHLADVPARYLSAGQRRRTSLARILASKADLWLLDEPTTALDKSAIASLEQIMADHRKSGGIAVVSTHAEVNAEDTTTLDLTPFANNRYNDIKAA